MEVVVIMGAVGSPVIRHNSVGEASPLANRFRYYRHQRRIFSDSTMEFPLTRNETLSPGFIFM